MKRRSQEEWRALFVAHRSSGLSSAAFCNKHGLCQKYFSLRRSQLEGDVKSPNPARSAFVPVEVKQMDSEMERISIQVGDRLSLKIPVSVSSQWLAELLVLLQEAPHADVS